MELDWGNSELKSTTEFVAFLRSRFDALLPVPEHLFDRNIKWRVDIRLKGESATHWAVYTDTATIFTPRPIVEGMRQAWIDAQQPEAPAGGYGTLSDGDTITFENMLPSGEKQTLKAWQDEKGGDLALLIMDRIGKTKHGGLIYLSPAQQRFFRDYLNMLLEGQ